MKEVNHSVEAVEKTAELENSEHLNEGSKSQVWCGKSWWEEWRVNKGSKSQWWWKAFSPAKDLFFSGDLDLGIEKIKNWK